MGWPGRLSFNQYTAGDRPFNELLDAAATVGVTQLGLQRRPTEAFGFARAHELLQGSGIEITSYGSIGGWATSREPEAVARNLADNLRYLDQAVQLGTTTVTVGSGGMLAGDHDLRGARARFEAGLREILPHAVERHLKLAIEPLHPVFCPEFSVLTTLGLAVDLVERIDHEALGLLVDTMHVWWDPELLPLLRRARGRVFLVQINDWLVAAEDRFDRGLMGEGCIDFEPLLDGLDQYTGWYEVETLNPGLRSMDLVELLRRTATSFEQTIGQRIAAA